MSLGFEIHPEARAEFSADINWYYEHDPRLAERFEDAVKAAIHAAIDSPAAWAKWPDWEREPVVRSKKISEFPYRIIYFVESEVLKLVAVAHTSREPGYWHKPFS